MATEQDASRLSGLAALHEQAERKGNEVLVLALGMLQASAASARLNFGETSVTTIGIAASPDDKPQLSMLEDLIDGRCGDGAPVTSDLKADSSRVGSNVFIIVPLVEPDSPITYGALAAVFDKNVWAGRTTMQACIQMAALMASTLKVSGSQSDLEQDLADATRRERHLSQKIKTDPITRVDTEASFAARAAHRMSDDGLSAALLRISPDRHAEIVKNYGSSFGDLYLTMLADAVKSTVSNSAIVGRTGASDFSVLFDIPDSGRSYLDTEVLRIRNAVQRALAFLGKRDLGGISIGISTFPRQSRDFSKLASQAEAALWAARDIRLNSTFVYDHGLPIEVDPAKLGQTSLPEAEQIPTLAPIRQLSNGQVVGLDVFSPSPQTDWAAPDRDGMASHGPVDVPGIDAALQKWSKLAGVHRVPLWIEFDVQDLVLPEFVFELEGPLTRHGAGWSDLVVVVREESMLRSDKALLRRSLGEMRQRGSRVALGGFGTGSSGLLGLHDLPVDIIRVSQRLIATVGTDPKAHEIAKAVVGIAEICCDTVVAEGVSTSSEAAVAQELGCDLGCWSFED